jgi:mRNA interferase MazF
MRNAPVFRITVDPAPDNGLQKISRIRIDTIVSVPRERGGAVIGRLDDATMPQVSRSLAVFTGIA